MGYIKERIKHVVRFRHKRGYGVHSPFMFNLILNVIRDKEKRFTYPEALEKDRALNNRGRKVFRLLSRLIRFLRVQSIICIGKHAELYSAYLSLEYGKDCCQSNCLEDLEKADFIYIGRKAKQVFQQDKLLATELNFSGKCLLIADIHKDALNGRIWREHQSKAKVSVDMMWYGILLFDDNIQKGRYNLMI